MAILCIEMIYYHSVPLLLKVKKTRVKVCRKQPLVRPFWIMVANNANFDKKTCGFSWKIPIGTTSVVDTLLRFVGLHKTCDLSARTQAALSLLEMKYSSAGFFVNCKP